MCGNCDQLQLQDEREARGRVIKCLSLWQPWAEAMKRRLKANETRSWGTAHRGWLAIHAAKKPYRPNDYEPEFQHKMRSLDIWPHRLDYGSVVCIVWQNGCSRTESVRSNLDETEIMFGDYSDCRYAWITAPSRLIVLPKPIQLRGHQGLFEWQMPEEVAELVERANRCQAGTYPSELAQRNRSLEKGGKLERMATTGDSKRSSEERPRQ